MGLHAEKEGAAAACPAACPAVKSAAYLATY
jgi:hypothetical protein